MNKVFLDSNILIYLYSSKEPKKQTIARNLITEPDQIFVSTQVLFEFTSVMHKKLNIDYSDIEKSLLGFQEAFAIALINFNTMQTALKIASKNKYSFADSLILSSAIENECSILFTEDMHDGHVLKNSLKIVNPFM